LGWEIHLHLLAAISWIGGSVFYVYFGESQFRDKENPRIEFIQFIGSQIFRDFLEDWVLLICIG